MIIIIISKLTEIMSSYSFIAAVIACGITSVVIHVGCYLAGYIAHVAGGIASVIIYVSCYLAGCVAHVAGGIASVIICVGCYLAGCVAHVAGGVASIVVFMRALLLTGCKSKCKHDCYEAADKDRLKCFFHIDFLHTGI